MARWGTEFDADRLAGLELASGRPITVASRPACSASSFERSGAGGASSPRALAASLFLTRAAAGFARADGNYDRFAPDIARGYRMLGVPADVDAGEVADRELRWWVVRREIGLSAGSAAGAAITALYAALYGLPAEQVAEAGRLRGTAAEVRDRGAHGDPDGPRGSGAAYWPEVGRLLLDSYRELKAAIS
jgi:hypothetical protein